MFEEFEDDEMQTLTLSESTTTSTNSKPTKAPGQAFDGEMIARQKSPEDVEEKTMEMEKQQLEVHRNKEHPPAESHPKSSKHVEPTQASRQYDSMLGDLIVETFPEDSADEVWTCRLLAMISTVFSDFAYNP